MRSMDAKTYFNSCILRFTEYILWKMKWEVQAMRRAYRTGQERPVTFVKLLTDNCEAECFKAKRRDYKHKLNSLLMQNIARLDDQEPEVWTDLA